jgi:carbamoyltransferase
MIVLGVSPLDKDATVTLMADGRVIYSIAEERLSRQKMHAGFPRGALEMVLARSGVKPSEVSCVAYAFLDHEREAALMRKNRRTDFVFNRQSKAKIAALIREARLRVVCRGFQVHGLSSAMEVMHKSRLKQAGYRLLSSEGLIGDWSNRWQYRRWINEASVAHQCYEKELLNSLRDFGLEHKLTRFEHHETHVANAFYLSGFERALVLTLDGYGSGLSGSVSVAEEKGIRRLHGLETPYSLGTYYESVTSALGFRPDRHAGKTVGLAAFGDPEVLGDLLRSLFFWFDGGFRILRSSDLYLSRRLATSFPKIDVAAAYQMALEEVVCRYVEHYLHQSGTDSVVLSGGVAANVKLNQRIHEIPGVRRIYIHPNMGDGGCGTGAALLEFVRKGVRPEGMTDAYLGPDYTESQMESALRTSRLPYHRSEDIEVDVARLVAENNVVARFNGRMEYGPRALGNRSILYQAIDPTVNQWLNARLGRTEFMPFAPATLNEDRHLCYEHCDGAEFTAQFMTITFNCTPWMRRSCPAAVHVDGTARPQLVTRSSNPNFHRILTEYKKLSGLPSLINTSFNMHEEPIVCSPEDAIRSFLQGKLDYLAMGSFLVKSPLALDKPERRSSLAAMPVS